MKVYLQHWKRSLIILKLFCLNDLNSHQGKKQRHKFGQRNTVTRSICKSSGWQKLVLQLLKSSRQSLMKQSKAKSEIKIIFHFITLANMFTCSGKRKTFSRKVWKTMRSFLWIFQTSDILCCKRQIRWECLLNFFKCIDFFIIISRRLLIPFPKMDTKLLLILLRNYIGCI